MPALAQAPGFLVRSLPTWRLQRFEDEGGGGGCVHYSQCRRHCYARGACICSKPLGLDSSVFFFVRLALFACSHFYIMAVPTYAPIGRGALWAPRSRAPGVAVRVRPQRPPPPPILVGVTDFAAYSFATLCFATALQALSSGTTSTASYASLLASTTCGVAAVHYFFIKTALCKLKSDSEVDCIRYRDWAISLVPMTLELQMLAQSNPTMYDWMNHSAFSAGLFFLAVLGQPAMVFLGTHAAGTANGRLSMRLILVFFSAVIFATTAGLTTWRALQPLGNHQESTRTTTPNGYDDFIYTASNEAEFKAEMWAVLVLYVLQCAYPVVYAVQECSQANSPPIHQRCSVAFTVLDICTKAGLALFTLWLHQYNMLFSAS